MIQIVNPLYWFCIVFICFWGCISPWHRITGLNGIIVCLHPIIKELHHTLHRLHIHPRRLLRLRNILRRTMLIRRAVLTLRGFRPTRIPLHNSLPTRRRSHRRPLRHRRWRWGWATSTSTSLTTRNTTIRRSRRRRTWLPFSITSTATGRKAQWP